MLYYLLCGLIIINFLVQINNNNQFLCPMMMMLMIMARFDYWVLFVIAVSFLRHTIVDARTKSPLLDDDGTRTRNKAAGVFGNQKYNSTCSIYIILCWCINCCFDKSRKCVVTFDIEIISINFGSCTKYW